MITAQEIAQLLGGFVQGNPDVVLTQPAKIEEAQVGSLTFLANYRYEKYLYQTQASAVLVALDFQPKQMLDLTLIRVPDVYAAMTQLLQFWEQAQAKQKTASASGIDALAFVHPSAKIDPSVQIGAFAYVGPEVELGPEVEIYPHVYLGPKVSIGAKTRLYSGVRVYEACRIGANCLIHANAVIGADGFGFAPQSDGTYQKIPQLGWVEIQDGVEIGANTCIDRATMGRTLIQTGVKLDNLIQVAHNVEIGAHTVIAAQAAIAGSTKLGPYCQIGGQSGIVGHLNIAQGTKLQGQSGIDRHIKQPNQALYGSPALAYTHYLRSYALFKQLPEMERRLRDLEKRLGQEPTKD